LEQADRGRRTVEQEVLKTIVSRDGERFREFEVNQIYLLVSLAFKNFNITFVIFKWSLVLPPAFNYFLVTLFMCTET
jgi:hypothetical protein